ncbi:MAG: RNA polymerase sigma factor [Sphingobacteriaceae bacterium]
MNKEINGSVPTDNEAILGILNNSEKTLQYIYKANFPMVLQLVINNSGDEHDAKDIYQEAIIILYNNVKSGSFELRSKLKTYIYSICRRLWLKRLSQLSKYGGNVRDFEDHIFVDDDISEHEGREKEFTKMEKVLDTLGEPCKTIIEDFYMHSKSMQDISEKFGYTNTDNAKNQKYKCLQRLKKLFFNYNEEKN